MLRIGDQGKVKDHFYADKLNKRIVQTLIDFCRRQTWQHRLW